jgi:hypothetical protein
MSTSEAKRRNGKRTRSTAPRDRQPCTFVLDAELVERARREVGEGDVIRSIEGALAAAIDYHAWVREVSRGERGVWE